jgi:hypothetical protein
VTSLDTGLTLYLTSITWATIPTIVRQRLLSLLHYSFVVIYCHMVDSNNKVQLRDLPKIQANLNVLSQLSKHIKVNPSVHGTNRHLQVSAEIRAANLPTGDLPTADLRICRQAPIQLSCAASLYSNQLLCSNLACLKKIKKIWWHCTEVTVKAQINFLLYIYLWNLHEGIPHSVFSMENHFGKTSLYDTVKIN